MNIILETPRFYLREMTADDAEAAFLLNADPEVVKYTGDPPFESIETARLFLNNYPDYKINGFGRWAVVDKQTNEYTGWCGLKLLKDLNQVDLGYRFYQKHWNKGYATETGKACIRWGFNRLNLNEIVGRAMKENIASIKVLEKCGMKYWKDEDFDEHPAVVYKIIKPAIK